MKKIELLAPAGNIECLKSAIKNGADAVYFSGKNFGARKYANNFSDEEIIDAIKLCHLYGVKAYITVNILIYEDELEECINYVRFLHQNNVDAIIVQDIGLISILRMKFPNLEVHASTQAHNHNKNGIELLKNMGVKRVVLAREMSLDEINSIDVDIEKEVFIHGALCVSYSGCCLFSSMNGNRSGNRGSCTGPCRLPYKLLENGKETLQDGAFPLSTRSLCTIDKIDKLIKSGIASLKIEGRMKSSEYVGYVTRLYRNKIDEYYKSNKVNVSEDEIINLKKLYNREFTNGFLFEKEFKNVMNIKTSNHIGTILGKVLDINKKYIKVKLYDTVYQTDAIRINDKGMILNKIYDEKGLLVSKVEKGNIALFDNKIDIKNAKEVRKTIDSNLVNQINNYEEKKIDVSLSFKAYEGYKISLEISDQTNTIIEYGCIAQKSIKKGMDYESIKKHIDRFGNTPFTASNINIDIKGDIFIPINELNDLRRRLVAKLIDVRENYHPSIFIENDIESDNYKRNIDNTVKINVLVRNEEQLRTAAELKVNNIYIDDIKLYEKYKHLDNTFYRTPRVNKSDIHYDRMLINDIGMLKYKKNANIVTDSYLNITNTASIRFLLQNNVKLICLSYENDFNNIKNLSKYSDKLETIVYGRPEVMIMKYCPIKMIANKDKEPCNLCYKNSYSLKDTSGNIYPIKTRGHITTIYHRDVITKIDDIPKYLQLGITNFRIDLTDESPIMIKKIIKEIRKYE